MSSSEDSLTTSSTHFGSTTPESIHHTSLHSLRLQQLHQGTTTAWPSTGDDVAVRLLRYCLLERNTRLKSGRFNLRGYCRVLYVSLVSVSLSFCVLVYGLPREQRGFRLRWDARTLVGRRPAALWVRPPAEPVGKMVLPAAAVRDRRS